MTKSEKVLYIGDNSIRKVNLTNLYVTSLATLSTNVYALSMDSNEVYLIAGNAQAIYLITISSGSSLLLAGAYGSSGLVDGTLSNARFTYVNGIKTDSQNNIYISDSSHSVRFLSSTTTSVSTFFGTTTSGFADGSGSSATANIPADVLVNSDGSVLFTSDKNGHTLRQIACATGWNMYYGQCVAPPTSSPTSAIQYVSNIQVNTYSGTTGSAGSADGSVSTATFNGPHALCYDPNSNSLFNLDFGSGKIRKISISLRTVSTIAGGNFLLFI